MEKKKIDFAKYGEMCAEKKITGSDGTEVMVRDHIPYAQKEEYAQELAVRVVVIHNDSCCYDGYDYNKIDMLLTAKYYTDIDTEGATEDEVADFLINNNLYAQIEEIVGDDLYIVNKISDGMISGMEITYEDDHSLKQALKTSFGFLFTGEDITESLAKAEDVSGNLFDAIAALRKEKQNDNPGKMNVNGNILNFAKKQ